MFSYVGGGIGIQRHASGTGTAHAAHSACRDSWTGFMLAFRSYRGKRRRAPRPCTLDRVGNRTACHGRTRLGEYLKRQNWIISMW